MRPTLRSLTLAALLLAGCRTAQLPTVSADPRIAETLAVLAADSLEGRMTGTRGANKAAAYIADEMRRAGLHPAGDSGSFFQRVPLSRIVRSDGQIRLRLLSSWAAFDSLAPTDRRVGLNVLGRLDGSGEPAFRDQTVLVDAHYDHLGIGAPVRGDSVYNGADDDASGVVAVLTAARRLAADGKPKRTVIFAAMTGEEVGLLGTRWFVAHPTVPLEQIVANLEIEMIGRPDSLVGGRGKAWLTGDERSTMGTQFRAAGLAVAADPHPDQHFFERSDNIAFARRGIVAHTLSSFNLHGDYHQPSDDLAHIDLKHLETVVETAASAVRLLADQPTAPVWLPGGQPTSGRP